MAYRMATFDARREGLCYEAWPQLSCFIFTQVYKWVSVTYCWGEPCDGLASHPGGSSNTSSCLMLKNWVKSQMCVKPTVTRVILPTVVT